MLPRLTRAYCEQMASGWTHGHGGGGTEDGAQFYASCAICVLLSLGGNNWQPIFRIYEILALWPAMHELFHRILSVVYWVYNSKWFRFVGVVICFCSSRVKVHDEYGNRVIENPIQTLTGGRRLTGSVTLNIPSRAFALIFLNNLFHEGSLTKVEVVTGSTNCAEMMEVFQTLRC